MKDKHDFDPLTETCRNCNISRMASVELPHYHCSEARPNALMQTAKGLVNGSGQDHKTLNN